MNPPSQQTLKLRQWFFWFILSLMIMGLFPLIKPLLMAAYFALSATLRLIIDLSGMALIAATFAALLAPLEALGWWAGWYGDQVDTMMHPGSLEEPMPPNAKIRRYVVYLDGISQAEYHYLPEVEQFLEELGKELPDDILIIRGLMPYSAINKPLTQSRLLSQFWQLANRFQLSNYGGILGDFVAFAINIRNIFIVIVAADQRYGPIYNQGTAQVIYNSLITYGYQPASGIPITLIGYSGGAQISMGAAPYLKRALAAPIEVISVAGVISGNHNALKLEHLYHLVGEMDSVERQGPILFPRRWPIFFLSYWNRAKRRGKISLISLGPVGHNGAGGPYDDAQFLPDGRSFLRQTVDLVSGIIQGTSPVATTATRRKPSNYQCYQAAAFNQPSYYPLNQTVDAALYQPIGTWMGRLILPQPEERRQVQGAWLEVHHADAAYQDLVGQIIPVRWSQDAAVKAYLKRVTKDLHFSDEANYTVTQGMIHPERLNHWQMVDPLESLAGARPHDDMIVMLPEPITVEPGSVNSPPSLIISHEPIAITGRYYGLVKILQPATPDSDQFRVVHYCRSSQQFDGREEVVCIPEVVVNLEGVFASSNRNIDQSPLNESGWYIYGAKNPVGMFVVQGIAPRALWRLQPDEIIVGKAATQNYIKQQVWEVAGKKGTIQSVLLSAQTQDHQAALQEWQVGDRALLIHVYGGIGGNKAEAATQSPLYFGHFAYGVAKVIREPLTDELRFDIYYFQVYTHNGDGLISGTMAWNRYMGDRQYGWLGLRPVVDVLIQLDAVTGEFDVNGVKGCALDGFRSQLETMMARYRIGDGTGGTYVGAANNCSQDSNQALYATLKAFQDEITHNPQFQIWLTDTPEEAARFQQLSKLIKSLKRELAPFGTARADWLTHAENLGISPEEDAFENILRGLISWRTLFPRLASQTITQLFLEQGASVWVLRTVQVGGDNPDIEPVAPTRIGW